MQTVTYEGFGGLNLVADPQELGAEQATSLLNVTVDRNGRVRTRDGYTVSYDSGEDSFVSAMFPVSGDVVLAAFSATKVRAVDLGAGTSLADVTLAATSSSFAAAGTSGGIYFTDGTTTQIRRYQGGSFTSPAGLATYEGNHLAVQPIDDRLVIADANSTSKLWFSDAATPETIGTDNFVQLTPGDGEAIQGMATFANELYVFKQTKFFVFYGNTPDETGAPIFNYRMVDAGIGVAIPANSLNVVAAHETGVYFIGTDGVYRTTGGLPQKMSGLIDPVFAGMSLSVPAPFSSVLTSPITDWYGLSIARDQLFATGTHTATGLPIQFVLDLTSGAWTVYDWPIFSVLDGSLLGDSTNFRGALVLGGQSASDDDGFIGKSARGVTVDPAGLLAWHHQSGFYDLGSQNSKRVRQFELWGAGVPTVSVFTDHGTSDANAAAVSLAALGSVSRGYHRKAYRGVLFSHKLSGQSAATVHRIALRVADERGAQ